MPQKLSPRQVRYLAQAARLGYKVGARYIDPRTGTMGVRIDGRVHQVKR